MISRYIEQAAPSITCRANVQQPVLSGFASLDTLIPVGRGQRQLIIGDKGTGKETVAKGTIMSQKRNNR